jgi:8-oxo-dGTP pyrophosphatase MutT (NUDIX family)
VTDPLHRLLVFDHMDSPDAGTQVPAGGIKRDEAPEAAVGRELFEESGLRSTRLVRKLGESWFVAPRGMVPAGVEEQIHHAFHLHLDAPTEAVTWEWDECSDGDVPLHRFVLRWTDLEEASSVLHPIQAMWLAPLRTSLATM